MRIIFLSGFIPKYSNFILNLFKGIIINVLLITFYVHMPLLHRLRAVGSTTDGESGDFDRMKQVCFITIQRIDVTISNNLSQGAAHQNT